MTSFQRMVLIAAALFIITAHVTNAQCGCFGVPRQQEIKSTVASRYHDSLTATASDLKDHLNPSTQYSLN